MSQYLTIEEQAMSIAVFPEEWQDVLKQVRTEQDRKSQGPYRIKQKHNKKK